MCVCAHARDTAICSFVSLTKIETRKRASYRSSLLRERMILIYYFNVNI